jgi:CRISPR-associated endonuclease/helicase Cas3
MSLTFEEFFRTATRSEEDAKGQDPYPYQIKLAREPWPKTRIIPTGFGKTSAVLSAWLWKRASRDDETPNRLVYCLPMRTLVEQTEKIVRNWVEAAQNKLGIAARVHVLMGGVDAGRRRGVPDWIMEADEPTIIVGTQDLLVSAALMRGYAVSRYRWPVDFALMNNGALWVFDEVQLTGASLPTSAQLEAFRHPTKLGTALETRTLWMSATLDAAWLRTFDFNPNEKSRPHDLTSEDINRTAHLWQARKRLSAVRTAANPRSSKELDDYASEVAEVARNRLQPGAVGIIFLNTVARAQAVYAALPGQDGPERIVLHSRFRAKERQVKMERLLSRAPAVGRLVVATQALEAGVDVTCSLMLSEIAPWPSLVQRFGRCNRYGECGEKGAEVVWIDLPDEAAAPYTVRDLDDARQRLNDLNACGPEALSKVALPRFPQSDVIRRRDLLDLFDTEPDLAGFDIDVSRYVRDADDTDVRLFWREIGTDPPPPDEPGPARDELCPAPIGGARTLLHRKGVRAWRWDPLDRRWTLVTERDLYPGLVLMLDSAAGGYDQDRGFDPNSTEAVVPLPPAGEAMAANAEDRDTDARVRISLKKHSAHVRDEATRLCSSFRVHEPERSIIIQAGLWHDLGKAHPAFVTLSQSALTDGVRPPLAKWPMSKPEPKAVRPHFRHELASALGFMAAHNWADGADLCAYLIAAHHGKVRTRIRALPAEAQPPEQDRLFARGVWDGDVLPRAELGMVATPELKLDLDLMQLGDGPKGPSWSVRVQALLEDYGPFRLAFFEALVRIADWRASRAEEQAGHDDL